MAPSPGAYPHGKFSAWMASVSRSWVFATILLWWAGFMDACCFNRVYVFCKRSKVVRVKTGQCFLLNGCIFLGSVLALQKLVVPTLNWLFRFQIPIGGKEESDELALSGLMQSIFVAICYVFWLYPLYIISFIINCIWYNEIAQHAFQTLNEGAAERHVNSQSATISTPVYGIGTSPAKVHNQKSTFIEGFLLGVGEQIYSVLMVSAFFIEVFVTSFIPYVGQFFYFLLLSWLYAYYCFDYKWGFARWSLERRLVFFESNWAFFAGFGSPCVLATVFLSPLVGAGVMAVLFPLFVLVATASDPERKVHSVENTMNLTRMRRLPIFYSANIATLPLLRLIQKGLPFTSLGNSHTVNKSL